jgi:DNA-binding SARP family transcriptional activator
VIEMLTLGDIDLRGVEGDQPQSLLRQPKRFALLAYLALSRPRRFHRRATLLALFWPELDAERARAALRQAVHVLRRLLGERVLVSLGDEELGLDPSAIRCDATAFEAAIAAGRIQEGLELYEGPLLPGFFAADAPGFERWLEDERARLRTLAVGAARQLSTAAEAAGDLESAICWARLAVHHAEHDECSYRRLIALLGRAGDRAGALAAYLQLSRRLSHDFGCTPSPETQELIEAVRTRGTPVPTQSRPAARPHRARTLAGSST